MGADRGGQMVAWRFLPALAIALALLPVTNRPAATATATGTVSVAIVIQSTCQIASNGTPDFGLRAGASLSASIAVQCTYATPYNLQMDQSSSGLLASPRTITSGVAAVYSTASQTNAGNTAKPNTVSGERNSAIRGAALGESHFAPAASGDMPIITVTY